VPTKAQLEERIMEMHSDAEHVRRKHADEVEALEATVEDLTARCACLQGAITPTFLPHGSNVKPLAGTAHCPLCNAFACAAQMYSKSLNKYVVVTRGPINHVAGCIFAEQTSPVTLDKPIRSPHRALAICFVLGEEGDEALRAYWSKLDGALNEEIMEQLEETLAALTRISECCVNEFGGLDETRAAVATFKITPEDLDA